MRSMSEALLHENLRHQDNVDHVHDVHAIFAVAQLFLKDERRQCDDVIGLLERKLITVARDDLRKARDLCRNLKVQTSHHELGSFLHERDSFFTAVLSPHVATPIVARTQDELNLLMHRTHQMAHEPFNPAESTQRVENIAASLTYSLTAFATRSDVNPYCHAFENTAESVRQLNGCGRTADNLRGVLQHNLEEHLVKVAVQLFNKSTHHNLKRIDTWEIVANPILKNVVRIVVNTQNPATRSKASFALQTMLDLIKKDKPKALRWVVGQYYMGTPSPVLTQVTDAYRPWDMLTRQEKIHRGKALFVRMLDI